MTFRQWLSLIILLVCLYILWQVRNVLLLGVMAIIFAVVLNRAVEFLQQWIASRKTAVLMLSIALLLTLGLLSAIIVPPFVQQLQELINLTPRVVNRLQNLTSAVEQLAPKGMLPNFSGLDTIFNQLQSLNLEMVFNRFFTLFSNTLMLTLNIFLVTALTIMMLLNPRPYRQLFVRGFPSSMRQRVWNVMDNCESAIAGWFLGILFNMTVIAVLSIVGLWILHIPLAFANGLLAGLLAFIPNLGPIMSVVPPVAIALLESPWQAAAVVGLYVLIQQIESNILTPMVMQKQVSLLPAVTLLSQIVFAGFFGFLGLFLALPLTLIVQNWLTEFWVEDFLDQH
jgi:predicted PurR-regulated permease PerM